MKAFESKLRSVQTAPHTQRKKISGRTTGFQRRQVQTPQMGDIIQQSEQQRPGSNQYGLSRFQYNQTMQGKLELRLNHHIDFQKNKTTKINNMNTIWYNNSQDLSDVKLKQPQNLHKIHNFKSYSSHKLFFRTKRQLEDNGCGNGGMLDQFYDNLKPYVETHQHGINNVYNHSNMTGKPDLVKKLGTNLQYDTQSRKTLSKGDGKKPLIQRVKSKRQLVFGKQVIDPKRACYR